MTTKKIKITDSVKSYSTTIGRVGEYGVTAILLDCSEYIENYGDGTATLTFTQPRCLNAILIPISQDNGNVLWIVGNDATQIRGTGIARLHWNLPNGLKKSCEIYCEVLEGGQNVAEAPEPYKSWIELATELYEDLKDIGVDPESIKNLITQTATALIPEEVQKYLEEHPSSGVDESEVIQIITDYWRENYTYLKGDKGEKGDKGDPGEVIYIENPYDDTEIKDNFDKKHVTVSVDNINSSTMTAVPSMTYEEISAYSAEGRIIRAMLNGDVTYNVSVYADKVRIVLPYKEVIVNVDIKKGAGNVAEYSVFAMASAQTLSSMGTALSTTMGRVSTLETDSTEIKDNLSQLSNRVKVLEDNPSSGSDWTEQQIRNLITGYGYQTSQNVSTAIATALTGYAKSNEIPTDTYINGLIDAKITPLESLADAILEVM